MKIIHPDLLGRFNRIIYVTWLAFRKHTKNECGYLIPMYNGDFSTDNGMMMGTFFLMKRKAFRTVYLVYMSTQLLLVLLLLKSDRSWLCLALPVP